MDAALAGRPSTARPAMVRLKPALADPMGSALLHSAGVALLHSAGVGRALSGPPTGLECRNSRVRLKPDTTYKRDAAPETDAARNSRRVTTSAPSRPPCGSPGDTLDRMDARPPAFR